MFYFYTCIFWLVTLSVLSLLFVAVLVVPYQSCYDIYLYISCVIINLSIVDVLYRQQIKLRYLNFICFI